MMETVGVAMIIMAAWPALDPRVETGIVLTIGLALFALSGICLAFGLPLPGWMLPAGVLLSCAGEALQWRGLLKMKRSAHNAHANDGSTTWKTRQKIRT